MGMRMGAFGGWLLWTGLCLLLVVHHIGAHDEGEPHEHDEHGNHPGEDHYLDMYSAEVQLMDKLMGEHHPHLRPVRNASETLNVTFGVDIISVDNIDEVKETITMTVWLHKTWKNPFWTWKPEDYDGVRQMMFPADQLWKPMLTLYNSADGARSVVDQEVVVVSDGVIHWVPAMVVSAHCSFDMSDFPFDTQTCTFKWGSWAYTGKMIHLLGATVSIGSAFSKENKEWNIKTSEGKVVSKKYDCCPDKYEHMEFTMTLTRMKSYYVYGYILPGFICVLLVPFLFLVPAKHHQKFLMGIGLIGILTVLIGRIQWVIPVGEATLPILVQYYVAGLALAFVTILLTILTGNLMERANGRSTPPAFLSKGVAGVLGRLLCVRHEHTYGQLDQFSDRVTMTTADTASMEFTQEKPMPNPQQRKVREWLQIALVLDRLFFLIIFVIALVCTLSMVAR